MGMVSNGAGFFVYSLQVISEISFRVARFSLHTVNSFEFLAHDSPMAHRKEVWLSATVLSAGQKSRPAASRRNIQCRFDGDIIAFFTPCFCVSW